MAFQASAITSNAFVVTPSDTARINALGFFVGGAGAVAVMPAYQEGATPPVPVTFQAAAGSLIPLAISRVMATGTTATNIIAFGPY
jgi:GTP cyclohydrolase III